MQKPKENGGLGFRMLKNQRVLGGLFRWAPQKLKENEGLELRMLKNRRVSIGLIDFRGVVQKSFRNCREMKGWNSECEKIKGF